VVSWRPSFLHHNKRTYVSYVIRREVGVHTRHNDEGDRKATRAYGVLDVQLNIFSALELERARGEPCLLWRMGVKLGRLH